MREHNMRTHRLLTNDSNLVHSGLLRLKVRNIGTVMDDKLTFEQHVNTVCKKAHQLLHFYEDVLLSFY